MNKADQKAVSPRRHNSMYIMLIISIAMYFVYTSLVTNSPVINVMNTIERTLPIWMIALVCILAIFSFVYYHYLCVYTLDEKMKDYGILISLGFNQNRMCNMFLWIMAKSLLLSLLYGMLIGTLIYYVILSLLNQTLNTAFLFIPVQGYIAVVFLYVVIYAINAIALGSRIKKMEIPDMLGFKKQDKSIKNPNIYQIIGIVLLVCGLLLLIFRNGESYGFATAIYPMLFLTASAYCLTMSFAHWFVKIFASSATRYQRNLFFVSQLRTNYKKYAKLLTACSIIVIFSLYMLIMDVRLTTDNSDHGVEMPYDFVLYLNDINSESLADIQDFENRQNGVLSDTRLVEILDGAIQWEGQEYNKLVHVMPVRSYTELTGNSLDIKSGEIVVLSQIDRQYYEIGVQTENGIEWGFQPPGPISFRVSSMVYKGTIIKEIWEVVYNIEDQTQRTYIVSDDDYEIIVDEAGYNQGKYFVSAEDDLAAIYGQLQSISPQVSAKKTNLETQEQNRLIVSVLILLAVMLLLFSLTSLIILRINQNVNEERQKYKNLYSIGYTYRQLQTEIRKEMLTLFFVPLVLGASISIMYTLLANVRIDIQLLIVTLAAAMFFCIVEFILCHVTVRALSKQYLG